MAFEQKDNSGVLFKNDKRENDSQPHAKGNALIDGEEYWVSAWTKTDKNGNKYQSLAFQRKAPIPAPNPAPKQTGGTFDDLQEIPF